MRPVASSLLDKLDELYESYGYCLNTLHSYEFDGSAGFAKMQSIMQAFRGDIKEFGGKKVVKLLDYAPGLDGLPKSDVLKFLLEDNCSIVVRPSGTEPKLKTYISVSAENKEAAEKVERILSDAFVTVTRMECCDETSIVSCNSISHQRKASGLQLVEDLLEGFFRSWLENRCIHTYSYSRCNGRTA